MSRRRIARLPIRWRVTAAFSLALAVTLIVTGTFLYLRLAVELDATIDQGLRARAGDVVALVRASPTAVTASGRSPLTEQGENLAQVVTRSGDVVDATPALRGRSLISGRTLGQAAESTVAVDVASLPGEGDPARLLATPIRVSGRDFIVIVGAPTEERREALRNLAGLLLVGGPVALLLVAAAGFTAIGAALRPVERMRAQAAALRAGKDGQRLALPAADDEIGRLGRTLNDMLGRLDDAFARERSFLADASHELRTPLAILKAELELAARPGRQRSDLEAAISSASEETDRLVQLAEDLLVIARADQGRLPIRAERLDLSDLLAGVARRFAGRAERSGAELVVDVTDGLELPADRLRIEQAVGNLVDNALRHAAKRVLLRGRAAHDGAVVLEVLDDGPGFPPEFVGRAFERFARADAARGRGGAGLGLSIVAAIAEAHGGRVEAGNVPPDGARVVMRLPASPPT